MLLYIFKCVWIDFFKKKVFVIKKANLPIFFKLVILCFLKKVEAEVIFNKIVF